MSEKVKGLLVYLAVYLGGIAIGTGFGFLFHYELPILANFILTDVIVTIYIWTMSIVLKSASLYDPYWSLQTVCMMFALMIWRNNFTLGTFLAFIPVLLWALRLTYNFADRFSGIHYEDWRYKMLREKTGPYYQMVSLFGIQLFPTALVFLASLPLFNYAILINQFSPFDIIGEALMVIGIGLEILSDHRMNVFRRNPENRGKVCNVGLWKYSRHPNYLGEVTFWWGVFLVYMLNVMDYHYLYWIASPIAVTILFLAISIPMQEKHLKAGHPEYEDYIRSTSMFLLLPKKHKAR